MLEDKIYRTLFPKKKEECITEPIYKYMFMSGRKLSEDEIHILEKFFMTENVELIESLREWIIRNTITNKREICFEDGYRKEITI